MHNSRAKKHPYPKQVLDEQEKERIKDQNQTCLAACAMKKLPFH